MRPTLRAAAALEANSLTSSLADSPDKRTSFCGTSADRRRFISCFSASGLCVFFREQNSCSSVHMLLPPLPGARVVGVVLTLVTSGRVVPGLAWSSKRRALWWPGGSSHKPKCCQQANEFRQKSGIKLLAMFSDADALLISTSLINMVHKCEIPASPLTDHCAISLSIRGGWV